MGFCFIIAIKMAAHDVKTILLPVISATLGSANLFLGPLHLQMNRNWNKYMLTDISP
jgi:hypothetical protein